MKKFVVLLSLVSMMLFSLVVSVSAKTFGKGISLKEETKISAILENPEEYHGKRVLVRGIVVEVCPKRGCWLELASDKGSDTMRVKVLDGEIVFPMDLKGQEALVEGVIYKMVFDKNGQLVLTTSDLPEHSEKEHKDDKEHEEKKKTEKEENAGEVVYQIRGIGAEVE